MQIDCLTQAFTDMQAHYNKEIGARDMLLTQLKENEDKLAGAKADIATWEQVQILLAKVSEFSRKQIKSRIEGTVTAALMSIITDEESSFRIHMDENGGQPTAEWQVVTTYIAPSKKEVEVAGNPEESDGGGVVDVIGFALRPCMMELTRPKTGGPIWYDEPGKMISAEYHENAAEFINRYAKNSMRQVVVVTHNETFGGIADVSYRVVKKDGVSEVRQLSKYELHPATYGPDGKLNMNFIQNNTPLGQLPPKQLTERLKEI